MASLNNFQTRELRVVDLRMVQNPVFQGDSYSMSFKLNCKTNHFDEPGKDEKAASVECEIELAAYVPNSEDIYARIEFTGIGVFTADSSTPHEEFEKMLRINGLATMLPILRGIIYNVSNTLTIKAPMLIPNLNVHDVIWQN